MRVIFFHLIELHDRNIIGQFLNIGAEQFTATDTNLTKNFFVWLYPGRDLPQVFKYQGF